MALLHWPGKESVARGALSVAAGRYRFDGAWGDGADWLVEGDNLELLAALAERGSVVDCCYLDPPYNTGHRDWIYPDDGGAKGAFPREAAWAGRAWERADRHDRWLSFIYGRLLWIRRVLKPTGALFCSIDATEGARLKLLCDEVFGADAFRGSVAVVSNPGGRSDSAWLATAHETLLWYAMPDFVSRGLPAGRDEAHFPHEDARGRYRLLGLRKTGSNSLRSDRPNLFYPFYWDGKTLSLTPFPGAQELLPYDSAGREGNWRWGRERAAACLDLLVVTRSRKGLRVEQKVYSDPHSRGAPRSVWIGGGISTSEGSRECKALAGERAFPTAKPRALLERIIDLSCPPGGLVLDPFAGSGTTMHALWSLNAAGAERPRRALLCEVPPVSAVTVRRLQGALESYRRGRRVVAALPGGFSRYCQIEPDRDREKPTS